MYNNLYSDRILYLITIKQISRDGDNRLEYVDLSGWVLYKQIKI